MDESRMSKRILNSKAYVTKEEEHFDSVGWLDWGFDNLKVMPVTGWGSAVKDRFT